MPKRSKKSPVDNLWPFIEAYADARCADEMKGGGDPDSHPIIEAELELARLKLEALVKLINERCDCDFYT